MGTSLRVSKLRDYVRNFNMVSDCGRHCKRGSCIKSCSAHAGLAPITPRTTAYTRLRKYETKARIPGLMCRCRE